MFLSDNLNLNDYVFKSKLPQKLIINRSIVNTRKL